MTGSQQNKFLVYILFIFIGISIGFLFRGMDMMSPTYLNPFGDADVEAIPASNGSQGNGVSVLSSPRDGIMNKMAIKTSEVGTKSTREMIPKNITKIIILTYRRSGSSFFAELFKQNHNIFYMFEPLKPVKDRYDIDTHITGPVFLKEIMNCRFSNSSYISQVKYMHGWRWNMIFRNVNQIADVPKVCANKTIVASKIIRLANIGQIGPFFGEETAILFLARDPRGILNSRNHEKLKYKNLALELKRKDMQSLCYNSLTNINFIKNLKVRKEELGERPFIMQVLYEDFANETLTKTKELYKTLNIPFQDSVRQWIENNTIKDSHGKYGTSRNSTNVPTKWKTQLSQEQLNMIQSIPECAKVIRMLGFEIL